MGEGRGGRFWNFRKWGGYPKWGGLFLKWEGLNPSTNYVANNHETVYSETCINWSCSKARTLLRRTDTFYPICFLYASLSRISEAKTVKRTLLQTDNFFQSSDKKATSPTRTQTKILGISEKQRIKLAIFVNFLKKKHFFTL